MRKRIIFGALMILAMAGLLLLDWWLEQVAIREAARQEGPPGVAVKALPLAVLLVVLTVMAFIEMMRLTGAAGVAVLRLSGLFGAMALGSAPFWWQGVTRTGPCGGEMFLVLGLILVLVFLEQMVRARTADALRRVACTLLAVLYLGVGGAMILSMRLAYGVPALVLFLAAVKFTDIGAYFTGTAIGWHKMIPWLSPGKSWEGLVGGLLAATGASILTAEVFGLQLGGREMTAGRAAIFGMVVGLAGQFGDLCESLLKRAVSAKDSGAVVPGFGGVLDILDSPLLAAPVAYLAMMVLAG